MIFPQPTVAEERRISAAPRAKKPHAETWRSNGLFLSITFFVLTLMGIGPLALFIKLIGLPEGFTLGVIALVTAEWLIRKKRFFGTGVESALWIVGLIAFITELPSSGQPEAALVLMSAFAFAGWRMRNAFFGTIAAILVIVYAAWKFDGIWPPLLAACTIAIAAAIALRREWQRPSTDLLFAGWVLTMPLAGYIGSLVEENDPLFIRTIAFLILGVTVIFHGVTGRDRILLIAGSLSIAVALVEAREHFNLTPEAQLIAAGVLLIAIATTIHRLLRGRTSGFVAIEDEPTTLEQAMQVAGTLAVAHPGAPAEQPPQRQDGGGSYGGAGASGEF